MTGLMGVMWKEKPIENLFIGPRDIAQTIWNMEHHLSPSVLQHLTMKISQIKFFDIFEGERDQKNLLLGVASYMQCHTT